MFENQARTERYNISKSFFACKMVEGSLASPHVIKMMDYLESLDKLCCEPKDDLVTDLILQLLWASYEPFIVNFHMNGRERTVAELHGMLKTTDDSNTKNAIHVMMIQKGKKEEAFDASQGQRQRKGF
jgi:hypothetical protein